MPDLWLSIGLVIVFHRHHSSSKVAKNDFPDKPNYTVFENPHACLVFEEFQNSVFDTLDAYDKSFLTQTMHHYHLYQCIASNFKRTLAHFPCKTALFLKFPMRHFGSHNSLEYLYKCNKQIQMKSKWIYGACRNA